MAQNSTMIAIYKFRKTCFRTLPSILLVLLSFSAYAQNGEDTKVEVILANEFHLTKPLTEIFKTNVDPLDYGRPPKTPIEMLDRKNRKPQTFPLAKEGDPLFGTAESFIQRSEGDVPGLPVKINQDGQLPGGGGRPYDPSGAVGPNHFIQMVNATTFRIYDKAGGILLTGTLGNLWSPPTANTGDPIVMYDRAADRWMMSQFGSANNIFIAISQTANPLGAWYTYTYTSPQFPDYLKFGVWHDAYYMTSNQGTQRIFAFNRSELLAGTPGARSISITYTPPRQAGGFFCPLPGDASDNTSLPPAGTPCPIMSYSDNGWGAGFSDAINIYNMSVNWVPVTPTATIALAANVATAAFDGFYQPSWNDCDQPGTAQKLDGIGGVLMYRSQWRSWSGYNSVVLNWGVKLAGTQRSIMWCELRQNQTTGVWSIFQQSVYTPDGDTRWMGSIAMNDAGAIGLSYIRSNSTTMFPSIYFTGRRSCDPLNTMTTSETLVASGTGSQIGVNRVGDYSQTTVDPANGSTFWSTSEYMGGPTGGGASRTRIFSYDIAPCGSVTAAITITGGASTSCTGNAITFTATHTNGGASPSYQWQVNGINTGTNSSTFSSSSLSNGDAVTCTVTSSLIGYPPATSNSIVVTILSLPIINGTTANPTIICAGTSSLLSVNATVSNSIISTLTTNNGFNGNAFDVIATNTITITGVKMKILGTTAGQAEVWYKAGGYGNAALNSSVGWTKLGATVNITGQGSTNLTYIPITATLTIPAGQTYGLVVVADISNSYLDGTSVGSIYASNSDLGITQGHGGSGFGGTFSFTNAPRIWSGELVYTTNAPNSYSWTPSSTLDNGTIANPTASPTTTTLYTVSVANAIGCSSIGNIGVMVNGNSTLGAVSASPTTICQGSSTTLNYTPPLAAECQGLSTSFAGYYNVLNWATVQVNSNGTVSTALAPDSINLISSNNGNGNSGTTTFSRLIPCTGYVSFNWTYTTVDGSNFDLPRYAISSGAHVEFPGYNIFGGSNQSGTFSVWVNAGDTLHLQAYSADNLFGPCTITIKNFTAPNLVTPNQTAVWYTVPTGSGSIGFGNTLIATPTSSGTITYYAAAFESSTSCISTLRTPVNVYVNALPALSSLTATPSTICAGDTSQLNLVASSNEIDSLRTTLFTNNGSSGNVFDIIVGTKPLTISGVKMTIIGGTQAEVWYKPGGYGNAALNSSVGWTKLGATVGITPAGAGVLTTIPLTTTLSIPAGQTYGLVVVCNSTNSYLNGTSVGAVYASNPDLSITQGHGGSGFGGTFNFFNAPRVFSGEIVYTVINGISGVSWTPPANLTSSIIAAPKAFPASSTIYEVTVLDGNGCSNTRSLNVFVKNAGPLASASATPSTLCLGSSVSLTYNNPGGASCAGLQITGFTGQYQPASWSTVNTNSNGSVNTAGAPANIIMTSSDNGTASAGSTDFNITIPCNGILSFNWSYSTSDGSQFDMPRYSLGGSPYAIFPGYSFSGGNSQSGTFNMNVTAGQVFSLQAYSTDNVAGPCTITISNLIAPNAIINTQNVVWFSAASGGTNLGSGNPLSITPGTSGTFTSYAQITNSVTGCTSPVRVATNSYLVNLSPTVGTTITNATICTGQSTAITGTGASTYSWQPGGLTGTTVNVSPAATTSYTVTGTAANGCTKTAIRLVTVNTPPTVGTTITNATICSGKSTAITGTGASTYSWQPGGLTGTTVNFSPAATTTYTVTGTAANGCTATAIRLVTVIASPTVGTTITNTTICLGQSTAITGTGASTYTWQPGGLSGTTVNVSPATTTTYTVTGTAANGCTATSTRQVTVTGPCGTILTVKVFIEGYYVGVGLMGNVMQAQGIVGATATQTDTITVELRNSTPPYAIAATQKRILNTNGNSSGNFSVSGNYYIVIKHRNGLQTWSANPVNVSGGTVTYDFSNAANKAYGNNQSALGAGVFGIYSGDVFVDENIELLDLSVTENDIFNFSFGYFATDINGDGNVDILDTPTLEANVNNFVFSSHP